MLRRKQNAVKNLYTINHFTVVTNHDALHARVCVLQQATNTLV